MPTTQTPRTPPNADRLPRGSRLRSLKWTWVSDGAGAVSSAWPNAISGMVLGLETIPDGGGTQPTSYAAAVNNAKGTDTLGGTGTARSITAKEYAPSAWGSTPNGFPLIDEIPTLVISGAGAAKGGIAELHYLEI